MWWQFQAKPSFPTSLTRIIGPDACPEDAAIIVDKKIGGQYPALFLKRPTISHYQETNLNLEILKDFAKTISENRHFYYLYYGKQDYAIDPTFIDLANHYPGKSHIYEMPTGKEIIILFDIHSLLTKAGVIDNDIAQQQAKGIFTPWIIDGFQTRLKAELK